MFRLLDGFKYGQNVSMLCERSLGKNTMRMYVCVVTKDVCVLQFRWADCG